MSIRNNICRVISTLCIHSTINVPVSNAKNTAYTVVVKGDIKCQGQNQYKVIFR